MSAPPSIADLVASARRGDRIALHTLYEQHVDMVFGYCLAFCRGDRDQAQDLSQEAFTKAFTSLDSLHDPARFSGWLRTIARRTCLRHAERKRVERQALERLAHEPRASGRDAARTERVVAEVIAACPEPGQRRAAELFYGDPPHTTDQIAADLGVSRTAVTTRLHRFRTWARRRMLARLAEALEESP